MPAGMMARKRHVKRSRRRADRRLWPLRLFSDRLSARRLSSGRTPAEPAAPAAAPTVLLIGGFLTAPFNYWRVRRRLLERGAGRVVIAPLWPMDWAAASLFGFGPMLAKTRRALLAAWRHGGEQPIMVVAHSGGGLVARLTTVPIPLHGRRGGTAGAIAAIVTLGTPHRLRSGPPWPRHAGHRLVDFLDAQVPGATFAPRTSYLVLGSRAVPPLGCRARDPWTRRLAARVIAEVSAALVGPWARDHAGDGIVPAAATQLGSAPAIVFDDVLHGYIGSPWYGDGSIIDRWWPEALRLWEAALAARSA